MPGFVRSALQKRELVEAFRARPDYQQNEYLGWLGKAVLEPDKQKRLAQFLDELTKGDVYMGQPWAAPPPRA
jgi:hypothetical protein